MFKFESVSFYISNAKKIKVKFFSFYDNTMRLSYADAATVLGACLGETILSEILRFIIICFHRLDSVSKLSK